MTLSCSIKAVIVVAMWCHPSFWYLPDRVCVINVATKNMILQWTPEKSCFLFLVFKITHEMHSMFANCVLSIFDIWVKYYFQSCGVGGNFVLYFNAIYRESIVRPYLHQLNRFTTRQPNKQVKRLITFLTKLLECEHSAAIISEKGNALCFDGIYPIIPIPMVIIRFRSIETHKKAKGYS